MISRAENADESDLEKYVNVIDVILEPWKPNKMENSSVKHSTANIQLI